MTFLRRPSDVLKTSVSTGTAYGGVALMPFIYTCWLLHKNKDQLELNIPQLEEQIAECTTVFLNKTEK